jgi:hypothetical protein
VNLDRLDHLARLLANGGTRRQLFGVLVSVLLLGGLLDALDPDAAGARPKTSAGASAENAPALQSARRLSAPGSVGK